MLDFFRPFDLLSSGMRLLLEINILIIFDLYWIFSTSIKFFRHYIEFFYLSNVKKRPFHRMCWIFSPSRSLHIRGKMISANILDFFDHYLIFWPYVEFFRPFKCQEKSLFYRICCFFFTFRPFGIEWEYFSKYIVFFFCHYLIFSTIIEFFGPYIYFFRPFKCQKMEIIPYLLIFFYLSTLWRQGWDYFSKYI